MIEVEQVDADEFALLDKAVTSAEENLVLRSFQQPNGAVEPGKDLQTELTCIPNIPTRATNSVCTSGKRKLPNSFSSTSGRRTCSEQLASLCFTGKVHYAFTSVDVEEVSKQLLESGPVEYGFDTEWTVTYKAGVPPRPIALIQLCFFQPPEYTCLLLHISRSRLTPSLRRLLSSQEITKVGVGSHGDALKLQRDCGLEMGGVCDLSEYANMRLCSGALPPRKWSLAGLTEQLLGCTLGKSQRLRCSDWEAFPLTAEQLNYAAADAFASLRLFQVLQKMPVVWQPPQPPPFTPPPANPCPPRGAAHHTLPACQQVAPLQPAKLAVYQQHAQQGVPLPQVAAMRHIQLDTAQGYFAEAITAGHGYCWGGCGVPDATLRRVAATAGELLGAGRLVWEAAVVAGPHPPEPSNGGGSGETGCSGSCTAPHFGSLPAHPSSCQAPAPAAAPASPRHPNGWPLDCDPPEALGEGGVALSSAAASGRCPTRPVDLMQLLMDSLGLKLRELKEEYWEDVPYGHLRLALAHLGRCNSEW